jgi:hypothetical protein
MPIVAIASLGAVGSLAAVFTRSNAEFAWGIAARPTAARGTRSSGAAKPARSPTETGGANAAWVGESGLSRYAGLPGTARGSVRAARSLVARPAIASIVKRKIIFGDSARPEGAARSKCSTSAAPARSATGNPGAGCPAAEPGTSADGIEIQKRSRCDVYFVPRE